MKEYERTRRIFVVGIAILLLLFIVGIVLALLVPVDKADASDEFQYYLPLVRSPERVHVGLPNGSFNVVPTQVAVRYEVPGCNMINIEYDNGQEGFIVMPAYCNEDGTAWAVMIANMQSHLTHFWTYVQMRDGTIQEIEKYVDLWFFLSPPIY